MSFDAAVRPRAQLNGREPSAEDWFAVATARYGHFSSMQVRDDAVRGFGRHLDRLATSSRELFGTAVDRDRVRTLIGHALAGQPDASVTVIVLALTADLIDPRPVDALDVFVTVRAPVSAEPEPAWRVRTATHQRELPQHKHIATLGLVWHLRAARAAGYDSALFTTADGEVAEGEIWNLLLWDGESVVLPTAPKLNGITEQLLADALPSIGVKVRPQPVHRDDLPAYRAAAAAYSWSPRQPIAAIDGHAYGHGADQLDQVLRAAWDTVAWEPIDA